MIRTTLDRFTSPPSLLSSARVAKSSCPCCSFRIFLKKTGTIMMYIPLDAPHRTALQEKPAPQKTALLHVVRVWYLPAKAVLSFSVFVMTDGRCVVPPFRFSYIQYVSFAPLAPYLRLSRLPLASSLARVSRPHLSAAYQHRLALFSWPTLSNRLASRFDISDTGNPGSRTTRAPCPSPATPTPCPREHRIALLPW